MDTRFLIPLLVVIVVLVVAAVLVYSRRRKSDQLRQKFGSEYDRVLQQQGNPSRAETVLADRERRVSSFKIRALPPPEQDRYAHQWAFVQKQFVDDPRGAVNEADRLVTDVMNTRGYPMSEFHQRAADISVNYPYVVENYRAANDIVLRNSNGQVGTEELRKAMVHYRSLFDELLDLPRSHKEVA